MEVFTQDVVEVGVKTISVHLVLTKRNAFELNLAQVFSAAYLRKKSRICTILKVPGQHAVDPFAPCTCIYAGDCKCVGRRDAPVCC